MASKKKHHKKGLVAGVSSPGEEAFILTDGKGRFWIKSSDADRVGRVSLVNLAIGVIDALATSDERDMVREVVGV